MIETHSEHLLLRLMRRIREGAKQPSANKISGKDVAIYFFSPNAEGLELIHIGLDQKGELLRPWPDNQFEIDFDERFSG